MYDNEALLQYFTSQGLLHRTWWVLAAAVWRSRTGTRPQGLLHRTCGWLTAHAAGRRSSSSTEELANPLSTSYQRASQDSSFMHG
ncbi:hypothetical protein WJX81_000811 [Elliptochloris bilobata]|uniref:Uncharacterized protein n=1 Tax=Elliptochloris bilobata TaxID=381761 RepID=A0AAW1SI36_9CHLO